MGRSRGGFSSKIHAAVDALGNPLRFCLSPGQAHDINQARELVEGFAFQREYDRWLYRERHLVECFINKIKHFRRVFSRFEKLDSSYLGFLHLVGTLIWLR